MASSGADFILRNCRQLDSVAEKVVGYSLFDGNGRWKKLREDLRVGSVASDFTNSRRCMCSLSIVSLGGAGRF